MSALPYWRLTNPPIVVLLTFTAIAAGVIGGGWRRPVLLLDVAVAVSLCSMGARTLTNYVDRDMDARMERTKGRPLPAGDVSPQHARTFGLGLTVVGLASAYPLGWLCVLLLAVGLVDNIIVYNVLTKRRTPWNIVLAAPSGGIPALVGYASMTARVDLTALLLMALVVLWTPIHIWSLAIRFRDDYSRADVPMLPVSLGVTAGIRWIAATTMLLALFTVALPFVPGSPFGLLTLLTAAVMGAVLLVFSATLMRYPTIVNSWRLFKFTSPYLAVLFTVMAVDVAVVRPPW
ncbi:MAG TPA: heme o synthase [Thermoplasmata archaeon]|nr:heme o synthase [Thermoplasmata archaeon]